MISRHALFSRLLAVSAILLTIAIFPAHGADGEKFVKVQRLPWPEETHCLEMFSALVQGPDGRIYGGTCNEKKQGASLIAADLKTGKQEVLANMQEVCGEAGAKTFPQSKIHSQICFDGNGVAWFGTHSYEWNTFDQILKDPHAYSGGHLVTYDTKAKKATDLGILIPHESIMSLALAEKAGKVYCVMHPTGRFVVYDIATKKVTDKGMLLGYPCRTIVALSDGRAYTFTIFGDVVRYDPTKDRLEVLPVSIPTLPDQTDRVYNNPFALAVSADEQVMYGTGWTSGLLFEYRPNDGPCGSVKSLGPSFGDETVPGKAKELCIAMATGKDGRIYYAGYYENRGRIACYDPKLGKRIYLGRMACDALPFTPAQGCAGALCVTDDGTVVIGDFDNRQSYYNWFNPKDVK